MYEKYKQAFDDYIYNLLEILRLEYCETSEYCLHTEKTGKMRDILEGEIRSVQQNLIEDCFEVLLKSSEAEMEFVFKKAFLCGVLFSRQL
ncbi:MAG: hypothetical protein FWG90_05355 [Oscillospiraceae bacterium]|nr:hypothetical protein [Oscillospiraceae bacterium]